MKEGDLLIPAAKPSMKGVTLVPKEYEGCICTNRFIVCKPKINARYLNYILRTEVLLDLLRRETTGSTTPDIRPDQLSKIPIPKPTPKTMDTLIKWLKEREHEVKTLEARASEAKISLLEQVLKNVTNEDSINDLEWVASNPPELAQYQGKYVAISRGKILGVGTTSVEALQETMKKSPNSNPLIMLVSYTDMFL